MFAIWVQHVVQQCYGTFALPTANHWCSDSGHLLSVKTQCSRSVHPAVGDRDKRTPETWEGKKSSTSCKYAVTKFSESWVRANRDHLDSSGNWSRVSSPPAMNSFLTKQRKVWWCSLGFPNYLLRVFNTLCNVGYQDSKTNDLQKQIANIFGVSGGGGNNCAVKGQQVNKIAEHYTPQNNRFARTQ